MGGVRRNAAEQGEFHARNLPVTSGFCQRSRLPLLGT